MGFAPFTPISCRGPTHYEQADGDSSCVPDPGGDRLNSDGVQQADACLPRSSLHRRVKRLVGGRSR